MADPGGVPRRGGGLPRVVVLCLTLGILSLSGGAQAGWRLDPEAFHMSAHGQLGCTECHPGEAYGKGHPNPLDVNKGSDAFFDPKHCLGCHEEVETALGKGRHGKGPVEDARAYGQCLRCHDPHTQAPLDAKGGDKGPSLPVVERCGTCHASREGLPRPAKADAPCLTCHAAPDPSDPLAGEKEIAFCMSCHGNLAGVLLKRQAPHLPLLEETAHRLTAHAGLACTQCHTHAAAFRHKDQRLRPCLSCHTPHDEATAHDAHRTVECKACHLKGLTPVRDLTTGLVLGQRIPGPDTPSRVHDMAVRDPEVSCLGCHFPENRVGAAAMILPPKGILCMPCHTATFTASDTVTLVTLVLFVAGLGFLFVTYLPKPSVERLAPALGAGVRTLFSPRIGKILSTLFWDVFLQRRLYRRSRGRWLIHSLIFYPFVIRFTWGFLALLGSLWTPDIEAVWFMIDKNHPGAATLFDVTGLALLTGVILALVRGYRRGPDLPGLPGPDRLSLFLLAGIALSGFVVEGMRMALTGWPEGALYAFVGYGIGKVLSGVSGLEGLYGYFWFAHAILYGVAVVYLPFSRMFHIILAPLTLVLREVRRHE